MKASTKSKLNMDIAKEWDSIALSRLSQLVNREDISMDNILVPLIFEMSADGDFSSVLDLGCGTGYVTKIIASRSKRITGIDISKECINEAIKLNQESSNIEFINSSIESYSIGREGNFTLCISNMTFMDVVNLENVVSSTNKLLVNNSLLVITITHPYFWPLYWDYANEDWFEYSKEIQIENNFKISNEVTDYTTTHFHRPLEMYINTLVCNNFAIEGIFEPMPSEEISAKYLKKWSYPRFIGIKCRKKEIITP